MMNEQPTEIAAIQRTLMERAQALARPLSSEPDGEYFDLAIIMLGAERYGLDVRHIREIQPLSGLTPIPGAPPIWAGLVNLRGQLYPILNLRRYLGHPEDRGAEAGKVILVEAAGLVVGWLADDTHEVQRVLRAEIAAPLADSAGIRREIVMGITTNWITVLDVETLLADPRLVVQDDAN